MIHFNEHVKLVELETLQVIVGSYGQNAYLEENLLNLNFMQTHYFHLLFYAAKIIFQ